MLAAMVRRISSAVLIGREDDLAALRSARARAASGEPTLAIVSGEAGVGKSRLIHEASTEARADGWQVLVGGAVGSTEAALPFAPFTMALRSTLEGRSDDELTSIVGPGRPHLARLILELGGGVDDVAAGEERYLQGRIFAAVTHTLEQLARIAPVILVVEDLHWADHSSRALLAHLVRALRGARILMLASVRAEDLAGKETLAGEIAELDRQAAVVRIRLLPLDGADTEAFVRAIGHAGLTRDAVVGLVRRSGGLPFYLEELLSLDGATLTGDVPPTVREIVLARNMMLGQSARELLQAAACLGAAVDDELLIDIVGLDPGVAAAAIRESMHQHFLVRTADDRLAFRHDIVREAIYADLLPGERRRLHRGVAEALARERVDMPPHEWAALIALQWDRAADRDRALPACVVAAQALMRAGAWREAQAAGERALALWPSVEEPRERAGVDRHELAMLAAAAAFRASEIATAVDLVQLAIDDLGENPDPMRLGPFLERLGWYAYNDHQTELSIEAGEASIAVIPVEPPTVERARALSTFANRLSTLDRDAEALTMAEASLLIAERLDDAEEIGRALHARGLSRCGLGDFETGLDDLHRSLTLAEGHRGDELTVLAMFDIAWACWASGDHTAHVDAADRLERSLEGMGQHHVFRSFTAVQGLEARLTAGDWVAVRRQRAWMADTHPGVASGESRFLAIRLAAADADFVTAMRLASVQPDTTEPQALSQWHAAVAYAAAAADDHERAWRATTLAIALTPIHRVVAELVMDAGRSVADAAAAARLRRDTAALVLAMERLDLLAAELRRLGCKPDGTPFTSVVAASRLMLTGEQARAAGAADPVPWLQAAALLGPMPWPERESYVRLRAAEAFSGLRDLASATRELNDAHAIAERLAAPVLLTEIEGLARRARIPLAVSDIAILPTSEPTPLPGDPFGLTGRELEVLHLLVQGRTNREIGEGLFISPKTAGVHVSNILGKLGVKNRVEAATAAHQLGIAG